MTRPSSPVPAGDDCDFAVEIELQHRLLSGNESIDIADSQNEGISSLIYRGSKPSGMVRNWPSRPTQAIVEVPSQINASPRRSS